MQWSDILARLNDLPGTFLRNGPTGEPFSYWQNALAAGLYKDANASDGAVNQATFANAVGHWIDVWGQIFDIPRSSGETDAHYIARIEFLLTVEGGSPASISAFFTQAENINTVLSENFSACSWSVSLSSGLATNELNQVANDLRYVRPAGVPFNMLVLSGGLYVGTLNYSGAARVTGSYLNSPVKQFLPNISPNTNNAQPTLPTVYLTDPTINPSLA